MAERVAAEGAFLEVEGVSVKPRSYRQLVISQLVRNRLAMFGAIVLGVILLFILLGGVLSPYSPYKTDLENVLLPPSWQHPMGTDDLGRDEATRILNGGRVSLGLGLIASLVSLVIGCTVGGIAGYYGGALDNVLMRITDTVLCLPWLFTMMIFAVLFGKGFFSIALAVGVLTWTSIARIVRASFLSLKEQDFVLAARSVGATNLSIMVKHVLPNSMAPVLVAATLRVGEAIIYESALSYLGLGIQPPTASWGSMLNLAQEHLRTAPWMGLFPGLMIFFGVLSVNLVGDGLRDALDPRHITR